MGDPPAPDVLGTCVVRHLACDKPHEVAQVFFLWGRDPGYCWLFPTTDGYNVGAGFLGRSGVRAKRHLDAVMAHCVDTGLLPGDHQVQGTFGGLALASVAPSIAGGGILLVGDTAGLLSQISGEGIYYAMRSGQAAGRVLAESLRNADQRYRAVVQPLVDEVTYIAKLRPAVLSAGLGAVFGLVRLGDVVGLGGLLQRPFLDRVFRRRHLPEGTQYQRLR